MFSLITRAFNQSKPFLTEGYQATKSGVTAALYVIKAGADAFATAAYTTKAVVKTAYYSAKHSVTVVPAAYTYYTKEAYKAKVLEDKTEESSEKINTQFTPGFNFDAYDETLDTYNEAWDAAAEDFSSTARAFADDTYTPLCDAAYSVGQVAYYTIDSVGHGLRAAGEGLLLAKNTAEYFLSSESLVKDTLGDDSAYELVEAPEAPLFSPEDFLVITAATV